MPLSSSTSSANNTTTTTADYTTTNIPAFLSKLWTLVEDSKYDELIAWDPSGFSFHVFDQTRFSQEILPRFFKHSNLASFIRQLNMYGFRKVNSIDHGSLKVEKQDLEFHHPYFIRGKEQFLDFIKRKVPEPVKATNQAVAVANASMQSQLTSSEQSTQQALSVIPQVKSSELNKVLDDVNMIKSKQKLVDDSLFSVKKENEALWKEIASLRQKHHHQQQVVNKLIHFLVHLVNPSTLNIKRTARPLMIDSHSTTASLVNADEDDQTINEMTNDEEEEEFVNLNLNNYKGELNLNSGSQMNNGRKQHKQLIELEDENEDLNNGVSANSNPELVAEETEENSNNSSSNGGDNSSNNKRKSFVEIETINMKKTTSGNNNEINTKYDDQNQNNDDDNSSSDLQTNHLPVNKRLKREDLLELNVSEKNNPQSSSSENTSYHPTSSDQYLYSNNTSNTNNIQQNDHSSAETGFLDPNLFLNTENSNSASQTPIITLPVSPLVVETVNNSNNAVQTMANNQYVTATPIMGGQDQQPFNNFRRTISSLKNSSGNQMNDHIESLQIDLNSIKEYLTNSSFSQIDPYTINNLFSPIVLDQMDNENYFLDGPPQIPTNLPLLNSQMSSSLQSSLHTPTVNTANIIIPLGNTPSNNNNNTSNTNISQTTSSNSNGKIIGNEIVQFQHTDIFDELFNSTNNVSSDLKDNKSKLSTLSSNSSNQS